ncbi:MAG: formylglycine-generating enzyme family protein [Deltaproteobacteria bacterium]|jgi:hypothetical protein|nr:formylglycine-generating enzyme family protein [Deltaproteobacteria bacterium]
MLRSQVFSKLFILVAIILTAISLSTPASAQIVKKMSTDAVSNPKPDDYDYIIPLPCQLTMAFRVIFIPKKGYLGEVSTFFGSDLVPDGAQELSFITRKYKGTLGSSLSIENLPADFQPKAWELKKQLNDDQDGRQLYLFGKYEVTNAQYQAVMNNSCDLDDTSAQPVANLSWYDAMAFTSKLMEYLLQNAPESLPRNAEDTRNIGLLRLPTEEEWEYAARGGHYVDQDNLGGTEFFPMEKDRSVKNYGLYYDEVTPPQKTPGWIGRFLPNQAGVYDTIGNVSEFIFEAFQMTVGNRLHGSSGGAISKGGSFRSVYNKVAPGAREEFPFFYDTGPAKSTDLGFRVMISCVNLSSMERLKQIASEYNKASRTDTTLVEHDPVKLVDDLIASAENPQDIKAFETLKTMIKDVNIKVNEQREFVVKNYVWSLVYGVMGMRANGVRIEVVKKYINILEDAIAQSNKFIKDKATNPQTRKSLEQKLPAFQKSLAAFQDKLSELNLSYEKQREDYNNKLLEAKSYPYDLLYDQLSMVKQDIKGDDSYALDLSHCFITVVKNLDLVINEKGTPASIKRDDLEFYPKS